MRNMLLSLVIVTAVGTGACGGGEDNKSASSATLVGNENSAVDSSAIAPTSGDNVGQATESLPVTASPLPPIGLIGILFFGAAVLVRRHRRHLEYRQLGVRAAPETYSRLTPDREDSRTK